jgi:hypothetical protein
MAVRFSATGQRYTGTLSAGAVTAFTVACWVKITTNRVANSAVIGISNTTADMFVMLTASDGVSMAIGDDTNIQVTGAALTVGSWYYCAATMSGTTGTVYVRADTANTWSTATGVISGTLNAATVNLGDDAFTGEWLNGCVTGVKLWSAALTAAELEQEIWQHVPSRTLNLQAWYPLTHPDTLDYNGTGHTLTGGTGVVFEDGPAVPWVASGAHPQMTLASIDTPPTTPGTPTSTRIDATDADITWAASTDDVGVSRYEIYVTQP